MGRHVSVLVHLLCSLPAGSQTFYIIMPEYLYLLNSKAADFLISYGAKKKAKENSRSGQGVTLIAQFLVNLQRIISVIDSFIYMIMLR